MGDAEGNCKRHHRASSLLSHALWLVTGRAYGLTSAERVGRVRAQQLIAQFPKWARSTFGPDPVRTDRTATGPVHVAVRAPCIFRGPCVDQTRRLTVRCKLWQRSGG